MQKVQRIGNGHLSNYDGLKRVYLERGKRIFNIGYNFLPLGGAGYDTRDRIFTCSGYFVVVIRWHGWDYLIPYLSAFR